MKIPTNERSMIVEKIDDIITQIRKYNSKSVFYTLAGRDTIDDITIICSDIRFVLDNTSNLAGLDSTRKSINEITEKLKPTSKDHNSFEAQDILFTLKNNSRSLVNELEKIKLRLTASSPEFPSINEKLVFLCHSTKDIQITKNIADAIRSSIPGIKTFIAHEDLKEGKLWSEEIRKALYSCKIFIPVITENFLSSGYANNEVGIAYYLFLTKKMPFIKPFSLISGSDHRLGMLCELQIKQRQATRDDIRHFIVQMNG